MVFDRFIAERLSPRELEVAYLMVLGYSNTKIAGFLFITRNTAKAHVVHIIDKLNAVNRVHVAFIIGQHIIKD